MRKAIIFLAFLAAGLALVFSLGGCAPAPVRIQGSGAAAAPPLGYIVWCAENPTDPMCGKVKTEEKGAAK